MFNLLLIVVCFCAVVFLAVKGELRGDVFSENAEQLASVKGAVFVVTNSATENTVAAYSVLSDGTLSTVPTYYSTNGIGSGVGMPSQGLN